MKEAHAFYINMVRKTPSYLATLEGLLFGVVFIQVAISEYIGVPRQ
jgi:hypothetical protein